MVRHLEFRGCNMKKHGELTASLEKYLKAIYEIVKEKKATRVKDVSSKMKIGASSTSEAIKALAEKKYIDYEPYGVITLSQKGEKLVEEKLKRNEIISNFLKEVLMIDENKVAENTEQIEYALPEEVLGKLTNFISFMQTCSCKEPKWMKSYKYYAKNLKLKDKCISCIETNKDLNLENPCCSQGGCNCS